MKKKTPTKATGAVCVAHQTLVPPKQQSMLTNCHQALSRSLNCVKLWNLLEISLLVPLLELFCAPCLITHIACLNELLVMCIIGMHFGSKPYWWLWFTRAMLFCLCQIGIHCEMPMSQGRGRLEIKNIITIWLSTEYINEHSTSSPSAIQIIL